MNVLFCYLLDLGNTIDKEFEVFLLNRGLGVYSMEFDTELIYLLGNKLSVSYYFIIYE